MVGTVIATYLWLKTLGVFNLDHRMMDILTNYNYQDNSLVLDRDGNKIAEIFDRYHVFVPYKDLPQEFINALIAIEDKSFYEHHGIDIKGILRAISARIRTGKINQGASTLTQQLVRRVFLTTEKTIDRKLLEIAWALEVEKHLSKEKIIEIYTNSMFLGHGAYGLGAAAQRYFGKQAKDLTSAESALIAGLFQSPSRYNPAKYPERAKKRQIQVIESLRRSGFINYEGARQLNEAPLNYKTYKFSSTHRATWFVDHVQELIPELSGLRNKNIKHHGLRIYTSLDQRLQSMAERSLQVYESRLNEIETKTGRILDPTTNRHRNASLEAAMLVTDPNTGDILAMVGGRDYAKSQFNRTMNAMRSPGSAFKPIVYAEALLHGYKWSDVIFVSPVNIDNYRPKNPEDDYLTETTMMRAFYRSMNAPTVEIATKIGLPAIISRARAMGIQSPIKNEFGTALGSSDVTMADLARVYGSFASGGISTDLSPIIKITDADGTVLWERSPLVLRQKRVLNSQISYLMTQGMKAVLTTGTGSKSADLARFAAGKTGTSNDSADNWFCGFTPDLVSIVWVGTDEHAPIFSNISGGAVALPIWDQFLRSTLAVRPPKPLYRPDGIIEATIHPRYGHRVASGAHMYFLNGNQPTETESALERVENSFDGGYRNVFRH